MEIKINKENDLNETQLIKLSASSTKTFEQCPKKYFYTYIDKLPRKSWSHLTLGTFCHKTLELFHSKWKIDKNLELVTLMGECFSLARTEDEFSGMSGEQLEEAKLMLQAYLASMEKHGMPNVLFVEEPFKLNIGKYLLRGFMDRVDVDADGLFHILDYKTTRNPAYLSGPGDDFQLLVYGLALKNKYPDMDKFRASYVLLRKGAKLITNEYSVYDIDKCEKKILDFGNRIENEQRWEKRPSALCSWCDFYSPCQDTKWVVED